MAAKGKSKKGKTKRAAFVYPPGTAVGGKKGKYPINTIGRARNALARSAQSGTAGSYSTVAKAVRAKYGNKVATVGTARGTTAHPGYARGKK